MLDCPSTAALPTAVEATGWAGPWELIWIGDFGGWSSGLRASDARFQVASQLVYKSFGTESMPGLRRAAAALSDCSRSLALDVPAPPSARLAAVLLKAHRACERYAVVAKAVRTTRTAVVYGVLSDRLVRVLRQAHEHLGASVDGALVGVGRPVVRSSAASTMLSHIDPVLGSVASMLAG